MILKEWSLLGKKVLTKAGFDNAFQEAKWLLAGALGRENSFITLNPLYSPSSEEERKIQEWLKRRIKGEPLSRIKGVREFWSLPFHLNKHTLDPRPETELLVEGVLSWVGNHKDFPWRILDLGTGSGCLLIALLHELKHATGIGTDINEGALSMAHSNATLNNVQARARFQLGNWGDTLKGPFDIIVSNPPYIPLTKIKTLEKGVLNFDPPQALFGGEDGLDCYRILSREIKPLLSSQGLAVFEIGQNQRREVEALFQTTGFEILFVLKDLAGIERAIGLKLLKQLPSEKKTGAVGGIKESVFP